MNRRSAGITDLRFGSPGDEDWTGRDIDAFLEAYREVPLLDTAAYYFVGVTVTTDPENPMGRLPGDLHVRFPSASGQGRRRRIPFQAGHGRQVCGLNHADLLHGSAVYEQLRRWLAG